ncbi:MAG: sodium ABC transporter permease [Ponticaulis sp.]|nr:sodium ABC transporter permease [Ponticaulis sp.]
MIEPDDAFSSAYSDYVLEQTDADIRSLIEERGLLDPQFDEDAKLAAYERALETTPDPSAAAKAAIPEIALGLDTEDFIKVPAPTQNIDELRAYLTGERTVSGPLGDRPLFAVFVVEADYVAYWSDDVMNDTLANRAEFVLQRLARDKVFAEQGISPDILQQIPEQTLPLNKRSPSSLEVDGDVRFADQAPFIISMGFSFLLWLLIFSVVNYLLTGTIEERSNKIFDSLLTSVTLPQLLAGKLFGVLMLSFTLIAIWTTSACVMLLVARDVIPPDVAEGLAEIANPRLIIPTIISFILGYLMFGSIFLALGSLCDTIQEAQSLLSPVIIMMIIPLTLLPVSLSNPDSPLLSTLTWVPVLSPFLIILSVPNDPPLWKLAAQIIWMAMFTGLILWLAAQIYRAGAVHGAGLAEARQWLFGWLGKSKAKTS